MTETLDLANPTQSAGLPLAAGAGDRSYGYHRCRNGAVLRLADRDRGGPLILSLTPCAVLGAAGYCVTCKSKGCDAQKTPTREPVDTRN